VKKAGDLPAFFCYDLVCPSRFNPACFAAAADRTRRLPVCAGAVTGMLPIHAIVSPAIATGFSNAMGIAARLAGLSISWPCITADKEFTSRDI
jgi:hypothetical protein